MDKGEIKRIIASNIQKTELFILECKEKSTPDAPDCSIDHSLRMEALIENELTLKTLHHSELKLKQLNRVLKLVDSNSFGICQQCKSAIPIQRLMIKPESQYCVNCTP